MCHNRAGTMMSSVAVHVGSEVLTEAQLRFAEDVQANPGPSVQRGVYLYRAEIWSTHRWLVAPDGEVLESIRFHKRPDPRPAVPGSA